MDGHDPDGAGASKGSSVGPHVRSEPHGGFLGEDEKGPRVTRIKSARCRDSTVL